MTKLLLPAGQPLAEARRQVSRNRQAFPIPTGEATTASSTVWAATATGSATPHTKGPWTQVVAATTVDIYGLMVCNSGLTRLSGGDSSALVDVGVGAAAAETVVIPDLAFGYRVDPMLEYRVPVFISAGSRIAVRCQGVEASKAVALLLIPIARMGSPSRPALKVDALNANTATSAGTSLAVPGATNTEGAWTELVASTSMPYTALMAGPQGAQDVALVAGGGLLDIGFGASGSEVVKVPNLYVLFSSSESLSLPDYGAWLIDIPTGTRISARYQASSTSNSMDVIVYGIR